MLTDPNQLFRQFQPAPSPTAIRQGMVSQILGQAQTRPKSASTSGQDRVVLRNPTLLQTREVTTIQGPPLTFNSPREQLMHLGQKYRVPFQGEDLKTYQKKVVKAIVTAKAYEHGIPVNIALGIAGNESSWTMWKDLDKGTVIQGKNIRDGVLKSTDWGVMQINDKAHNKPTVFPRVKYDLEFNIDYGLRYLSKQRGRGIQGSLGHGFGDWDRTVASYNLGHNPKTERSLNIAQRYVGGVHKRSQMA